MTGKLTVKDGKLCVLYESTLYSEPMLSRLWWVVVQTRGNPYGGERPAEGDLAQSRGNGVWHTYRENPYVDTGSVSIGSGSTEAIASEIVPVPSPKVRAGVQVRWNEGRWERLLKTGWKE